MAAPINPCRKLSDSDVLRIRRRYGVIERRGKYGDVAKLAAQYGVHRNVIRKIATGEIHGRVSRSTQSDRLARWAEQAAMRDEAAALAPSIRAVAEKYGVAPRTIARIALAEISA